MKDHSTMRNAVVTGASSGIGKAAAERLRHEGYRVVTMQRRLGGAGLDVQFDFARPECVPGAWERALSLLGQPPDLLVLNAGRECVGPITDVSLPEVLDTHIVNQVSPLVLVAEAFRTWRRERTPGHVVLVLSQVALPGGAQAKNAVYVATKSGLAGAAAALAKEGAPTIRVNSIAPGDVDTPLARVALRKVSLGAKRSVRDLRRDIAGLAALGRWVTAEEIVEGLLFLERCKAVTGAVLNISGGRTI